MGKRTRTTEWLQRLAAFAIAGVLSAAAGSASAAPTRQKARASAARPAAPPRAPKPPDPRAAPAPGTGAPASAAAGPAAVPAGAKEAKPTTAVVKTEELGEGVKAYTFGAQEVEGRLKSPQILYFLRRVRAEFDPAPLGHRSFLLELSDTRRHPAFE